MVEEPISRRTLLAAAAATATLGAAPAWAIDPEPVDVIVLGAGMSGLHAARMLQGQGASVAVLEGSPRIGGRVWTAWDVPNRSALAMVGSAATPRISACRSAPPPPAQWASAICQNWR